MSLLPTEDTGPSLPFPTQVLHKHCGLISTSESSCRRVPQIRSEYSLEGLNITYSITHPLRDPLLCLTFPFTYQALDSTSALHLGVTLNSKPTQTRHKVPWHGTNQTARRTLFTVWKLELEGRASPAQPKLGKQVSGTQMFYRKFEVTSAESYLYDNPALGSAGEKTQTRSVLLPGFQTR